MKKRDIWGILCFLILFSSMIFASYWTEWTEYLSNPVFDPALSTVHGYYPCVLYNQNGFSGHGDTAYYKMWFDRDEGGGIAYAYSNDGINWTEYNNSAALSGLNGVADHPVVIYNPSGFGGGIYYKLWYWNYQAGYATASAIRYAESADGISWSNDQPITQHATDTNLQLVFGSWSTYFYHNYGPGYIIYNPAATRVGASTMNDKSDDNPMTWDYQMYYLSAGEGGTPNGSSEQEALAYSLDGIYWIRYGNTPVLMGSGISSDWDYTHLYGSSIQLINGTYHMWYIGSNSHTGLQLPYAQGIGHASSPDGLNWTRDPDNPSMHVTDGISWRASGMHAQSVLYDVNNFSGHGDSSPVKIWYSGRNAVGNDTIGYAYIPQQISQPPIACFTRTPLTGIAPVSANFNASCSYDPDGTITNYRWNYGDDVLGTGINSQHTYKEPGDFDVILSLLCMQPG
jgi:hypothetical protein